jgi:hypothetical protein
MSSICGRSITRTTTAYSAALAFLIHRAIEKKLKAARPRSFPQRGPCSKAASLSWRSDREAKLTRSTRGYGATGRASRAALRWPERCSDHAAARCGSRWAHRCQARPRAFDNAVYPSRPAIGTASRCGSGQGNAAPGSCVIACAWGCSPVCVRAPPPWWTAPTMACPP